MEGYTPIKLTNGKTAHVKLEGNIGYAVVPKQITIAFRRILGRWVADADVHTINSWTWKFSIHHEDLYKRIEPELSKQMKVRLHEVFE